MQAALSSAVSLSLKGCSVPMATSIRTPAARSFTRSCMFRSGQPLTRQTAAFHSWRPTLFAAKAELSVDEKVRAHTMAEQHLLVSIDAS